MKVGVIGTGNLGFALGSAFKRAGHQVTYGAKEPKGESETSVRDVFSECEVVLLAVPFDAIPDVVNSANPRPGLIVVDCANPVSHDFTGLSISGTSSAERTANLMPNSRVVKAFNTVGAGVSADTNFVGGPPTMFIAGDDAEAVKTVMALAESIGYEPLNAGPLVQARELESLAWLWISMAYKYGLGGDFAFKVIKRT